MKLLFLYKLGFGGFFGCSECFPLPLGDQATGMRVQPFSKPGAWKSGTVDILYTTHAHVPTCAQSTAPQNTPKNVGPYPGLKTAGI